MTTGDKSKLFFFFRSLLTLSLLSKIVCSLWFHCTSKLLEGSLSVLLVMLAGVNTSNNVRQWAPHSLTLIPSLKRPAEQAHISHVVRQVPWLVVVISIFTLDWRWIRIQHWISFQNGVFGCGSLVWLLSFHDCIVMFCLFLLCRKVIQNAETFPRWLWKDRKTLLWLLMSRKARLKTNVRNNNSSLIKEFYRHGKRWKSENLRKFLSGKKRKRKQNCPSAQLSLMLLLWNVEFLFLANWFFF